MTRLCNWIDQIIENDIDSNERAPGFQGAGGFFGVLVPSDPGADEDEICDRWSKTGAMVTAISPSGGAANGIASALATCKPIAALRGWMIDDDLFLHRDSNGVVSSCIEG